MLIYVRISGHIYYNNNHVEKSTTAKRNFSPKHSCQILWEFPLVSYCVAQMYYDQIYTVAHKYKRSSPTQIRRAWSEIRRAWSEIRRAWSENRRVWR